MEYTFSNEEIQEIERHVAKYPEKRSAVMPALWIAQEKFGWLSDDAIRLVADTLELPFAHVYGVASFYTMYFKKEVPKHLIEICTCFSCGETGGNEMLDFTKSYLGCDEKGFSADGKIWVRAAECLGACDTAPVCQVSNRRYRHRLNEDKIKEIVAKLRNDEELEYERIPLYDQSKLEE
jgi:NADH-quinone oxidoreductase E subunit